MAGIAPAEATDTAPTLDDFLVPEEEDTADDLQPLDDTDEESEAPAEEVEADEGDEDLIDEEDGEEGEEDGEEAGHEALPMPNSWSKEDAKEWAKLTPEAQAIVTRREGERDKYLREVGFKASQTRQQVETEAREVLAQMHENHAVALQVYAQRITQQVKEPDQRLLYSGNPDDVLTYQRQDAAFRASQAQQQQLQQEIAQAQQHAALARDQAQQAERASDAQRLQEQLPEWFDPSEGPKLQQTLQSIGSELGYPVELMAEASSTDILALKRAADWKAKAEKYDKLMAKKMEGVRSAKELPRMARPGVKPSRSQKQAVSAGKRNQALEQFGQTRSGDAAAALLLERKR
jgi:hypothetical protein